MKKFFWRLVLFLTISLLILILFCSCKGEDSGETEHIDFEKFHYKENGTGYTITGIKDRGATEIIIPVIVYPVPFSL